MGIIPTHGIYLQEWHNIVAWRGLELFFGIYHGERAKVAVESYDDRIDPRNLTNFEDDNLSIDLATIAKIHLFKKVSLMLEHFWIINANEYRKKSYQNPFGIGIELNTFAHVFQLNFMNSKGLGAGQFIPFTTSNWSEGEFRFGFTIARKFNL